MPSQNADAATCALPLAGKSVLLGGALFGGGKGGIARVARLTARCLIEAGADVRLLSLLDDRQVAIGGQTVDLAGGSKWRFIAKCFHETARSGFSLYDSAGIARAHPRAGGARLRPYGVWMHGIEVWAALSRANLQLLRRADALIVNSHFTLRTHEEMHGRVGQAQVCWLGTEEDEPPERPPAFSGVPTALIVSRIDGLASYKGHAELIDCWPDVVRAVPDARLVIAGSGPGLEDTRQAVGSSPAAANIDLLGFVEEDAMPELWRRAHLLVMPSRKEGFGLVYVEAMRQGLPVIGSVHDAAPEVNLDGETGYNVDLDRRGELTERLVELLRSTDDCRRMGQAGLRRWEQHFRWSRFKARLEPILEAMLRGR